MRRPVDFERAVRRGARSGRRSLVVHLIDGAAIGERTVVGFVVSKAVGNAVVRNRVRRRLRAVVTARIDQLPDGGLLVVRALPPAAGLDSGSLASEFDAALAGARRRLQSKGSR